MDSAVRHFQAQLERVIGPLSSHDRKCSGAIQHGTRVSSHPRISSTKIPALKTRTTPQTDPRAAPEGRTYRELAQLFRERLRLYVAPSTLHSFVKVRAKHRKRSQFELPPLDPASEGSPTLDHRIAALRAKPAGTNHKSVRFVFREHEPPTLANGGER
jgi:hypothetical protein